MADMNTMNFQIPTRCLSVRNEETIRGTVPYGDGQQVAGRGCNYLEKTDLLRGPVHFSKLMLDRTLMDAAVGLNMTLPDLLDQMDPSDQYTGSEAPLSKMTALERQFYRYGFLPRSNRGIGDLPAEYATANTVANSILMPAALMSQMFWWPLIDMNDDPNRLLARTINQKEQAWRSVVIDDSQYGHSRLMEIPEMGDIPVFTFALGGYGGSTFKHGAAYWFSREFSMKVTLNVLLQCVERSRRKKDQAYFNHIISTIVSGHAPYGIASGVTSTKAVTLDSSCVADGDISFKAQSAFFNAMRPYVPSLAIMNINTAHWSISATPPANMITWEEFKMLMNERKFPDMPQFLNSELLGVTPPGLIVPVATLADYLMIYMDVARSLVRINVIGGSVQDQGYNMDKQLYRFTATEQDGLMALPDFKSACQILTLKNV